MQNQVNKKNWSFAIQKVTPLFILINVMKNAQTTYKHFTKISKSKWLKHKLTSVKNKNKIKVMSQQLILKFKLLSSML